MPRFETKGLEGDGERTVGLVSDRPVHQMAQVMQPQARGIDDANGSIGDRGASGSRSSAMASGRLRVSELIGCLRRVSA